MAAYDSVVNVLRSDKKLIYRSPPKTDPSAIERFLGQLARWLDRFFFQSKEAARFWEIVSYLLMGVAVVLLAMYIGKFNFRMLRQNDPAQNLRFKVLEEDIFDLNFDAEIKTAIAAGQFQRAVRLQYLRVLRLMDERKIIKLSHNLTNLDYLYQIKSEPLRELFGQITLHFEFVFYGDRKVDAAIYAEMVRDFDRTQKTIQSA